MNEPLQTKISQSLISLPLIHEVTVFSDFVVRFRDSFVWIKISLRSKRLQLD